ncbi:MAG: carboxylate--amine ligase [Spirochaetota bacterium]
MLKRPPFGWSEYADMELSTQVLLAAAHARGLHIEVLDRGSNTVRLSQETRKGAHKGTHSEIVIQATKTSADTYLCTELMALKKVSKQLLSEAGLRVPQGRDYSTVSAALADWNEGQLDFASGLVVKPNSTNYGLGISQVPPAATRAAFQAALETAFRHDQCVLVEEFIPGNEYRFLVIAGRLQAVLQRVPANVVGDGSHSIAQLLEEKNRDPWRSGPQGGHRSPLERLELNEPELAVLRERGLTPSSVPPNGERVFLRHNSNISTGGDSIDKTSEAHTGYKQLAERCAQTLGAAICGVDLITADLTAPPTQTGHAIIEANFNPVLYFHEYPAEGRPRPVAAAVLDLLFD